MHWQWRSMVSFWVSYILPYPPELSVAPLVLILGALLQTIPRQKHYDVLIFAVLTVLLLKRFVLDWV